jgi:hypothetical protein
MDRAKPREAGDRARRRLVLTLLVTGGALFVAAIVLATLNHTFTDDPFTLLSVAFLGTYAGVGAVLACARPRTRSAGCSWSRDSAMLCGGASSEYANYALGRTAGASCRSGPSVGLGEQLGVHRGRPRSR